MKLYNLKKRKKNHKCFKRKSTRSFYSASKIITFMLLSWPFKIYKISLLHFFSRFTEPRKRRNQKYKNVNNPNKIKNPN